ncbi:acylneuraminate cytidylyltransferase family protein [Paenibacillus sp. JMULE4]|uniref:acylneuraminate cytidylyltransferase family protein n=1 Tax=Paenibacillus sp. JMULE4 TaxID=2518342 RepID=UPI0015771517|nr:acylneuraminate cytidylyltransferase family protein [Paenibacillus sp. JMULE4]NTZ16376.1 acylneuraminate cytidylyltransferase family protein [Paenibacillus sp. JMULE4]
MINGKSVLGVIPARGGSKGVPRKNIREVAGKPLIAWTIEEAKKSKFIDRLILSSEDAEIIKIAKSWGCSVPFIRPTELSRDETPGIEPVLHAIKVLPGYDYIVLLQPTSPLRIVKDIDSCIEKCVRLAANACVSVTETKKSPYWMYTMDDSYKMKPLIPNEVSRRQDLPVVYALNGAIYVAKTDYLIQSRTFLSNETIGFEIPEDRSLDIDSELDLFLADAILTKNNY